MVADERPTEEWGREAASASMLAHRSHDGCPNQPRHETKSDPVSEGDVELGRVSRTKASGGQSSARRIEARFCGVGACTLDLPRRALAGAGSACDCRRG